MRKAMRESGVFNKPELNKKQIKNAVKKLVASDEFHLDRMRMEKLIDEHEKRRKTFIQLGIEEELQEEEKQNPGVWTHLAMPGGKKRYDFRHEQKGGVSREHSAGKIASSSIFNRSDNVMGSVFERGKNSIQKGMPVTSISRLNRPKPL